MIVFIFCGTVQALSWAYPIVVWEGRLYEVIEEEQWPESSVAGAIGKVVSMADDMSGTYYGNASNYYPKFHRKRAGRNTFIRTFTKSSQTKGKFSSLKFDKMGRV